MAVQQERKCEGCGLPMTRKSNKGPWPKKCVGCKRSDHLKSREQQYGDPEQTQEEEPAAPEPEEPAQEPLQTAVEPLKGNGWFEVHLQPTGASTDGPDDAQHDLCRMEAHERALDAGLNVRGGWSVFRLRRVEEHEGVVTFVYGAEVRA